MCNFDEDFRFLDYFSGLIDGEGCFIITKHESRGKFNIRFSIRLRADDAQILEICRDITKIGKIYYTKGSLDSKSLSHNPFVDYIIADVNECMKLIRILDEHTLRAKKKLDYLIWRDAVMFYKNNIGKQGVGHDCTYISKMDSYKSQLSNIKKYNGTSMIVHKDDLDKRQSALF